MSPRPAVQDMREIQRERILEAFEERARANGPRSVVMAELARDLGISTRTLYQHFGAKAELVQEIMTRWAEEMSADQDRRLRSDLSLEERIVDAAGSWIERQDRFSATFWDQLATEFPQASRVLSAQIHRSLEIAGEQIAREVPDDRHLELALSLLKASIRHALDPHRCNRLGISRQRAVREAVELWCHGALRPRQRTD